MVVIPQCQKVKKDGVRCGSPALRGKVLCYFHSRAPKRKPKLLLPQVPNPNNALAVLNWVLRGLMTNQLDTKAASQIIYGIQQMHLARCEGSQIPNCRSSIVNLPGAP